MEKFNGNTPNDELLQSLKYKLATRPKSASISTKGQFTNILASPRVSKGTLSDSLGVSKWAESSVAKKSQRFCVIDKFTDINKKKQRMVENTRIMPNIKMSLPTTSSDYLAIAHARKKAEKKAQLLANRISFLHVCFRYHWNNQRHA